MKKLLFCIYDTYIKLTKKIYRIFFSKKDDYREDYQDDEELDSLLNHNINHPFEENDRVLFY